MMSPKSQPTRRRQRPPDHPAGNRTSSLSEPRSLSNSFAWILRTSASATSSDAPALGRQTNNFTGCWGHDPVKDLYNSIYQNGGLIQTRSSDATGRSLRGTAAPSASASCTSSTLTIRDGRGLRSASSH